IVTGFFAQDDPNANSSAIGSAPARFGLLDTSPARWETFRFKLAKLNAQAEWGTQYKAIFFARHGEGFRMRFADNVAEAKYGTPVRTYWSKLDGDGEIVWGPDANLTDNGVQQAITVGELWKAEHKFNIPLPQKLYASPMRRALYTFKLELEDSGVINDLFLRTLILEDLREQYGVHTCDMRFTKTEIAENFHAPVYHFERGFAENDTLWTADERESSEHTAWRAKQVLDKIFTEDKFETYIGITAHSGIINGFVRTLGRPRYALHTGGEL
ncbi:histidine phosphatase superfamily, partial [Epithele typhae]|uniref:histidine phosphatase superfamily n=1 Tax=Epithele typhae TaxID=378194 RepID=UPI002007B2FD